MHNASKVYLPDLFFKPSANNSGWSSGNWMVSNISDLTWAKPPTSSQVTLGIFGAPMLSEYESLAFSRAMSKSLAVIDMEERVDRSSFTVLGTPFSYTSLRKFYKLTRTQCSLPGRRMRLWLEPQGLVNHLPVDPLFALPGAQVKHLKQ